MDSNPAQSLLYQLRSPTTPLETKLNLAQNLNLSNPSKLLSQLIKDWILLDLFLRSKDVTVIVNLGWWKLLSAVIIGGSNSSGSNTTSTLPIFTSFLSAYAQLDSPNVELIESVLSVWTKLAASAMRKATVDAALESYSILLKTSVLVVGRAGGDVPAWECLGEVWLNSFRSVVDAGKGKKIPLHTLSNLSSILPLLSILSPSSQFYASLLSTIQFSLFNVDNLRRGIARESYNAGGVEVKDEASTSETAEGELFNALGACLENSSVEQAQVYHALPLLFTLYRTSLSIHSTSLFPLPIRSSFPTASAARSALEIHSLQKLRGLAASWTRGVSNLMSWFEPIKSEQISLKATALWKTLQEVETGDLFRTGVNTGWELLLESLVKGSLDRLHATTSREDREPLLGLIGTVLRLNFEAIESFLPALFLTLASTPSSSSSPSTIQSNSSPTLSTFLNSLLIHHTRSLLLPSLLSLLSIALSNEVKVENSLLDLEGSWKEGLSRSITGLGSRMASECADTLVNGLKEVLQSEVNLKGEGTEINEREIKRRKKDAGKVEKVKLFTSNKAAVGRIQVLHLFLRFIPSPLPSELFQSIQSEIISPFLISNSEDMQLTRSILGLRYAILERMAEEGVVEKEVDSEFIKKMLSLVQDGGVEVVLEASRNLLQTLELRTAITSSSSLILSTILARMLSSSSSTWSGHVQGITSEALPVALWEMVARRWIGIFERFGETNHLETLAKFIISSISSAGESSLMNISVNSITARLLRRADFYEMKHLQVQVQIALLSQITITSLTSPTEVLSHLSATKLPKSLRSLTVSSIQDSISLFSHLTSLIPVEYLSKSSKVELIDRALGLDLFISSGKIPGIETGSEELIKNQEVLRKFVLITLNSGSGSNMVQNGAVIILSLLERTEGNSQITIELYQHFIRSAISAYKSDKSSTHIQSYVEAFEKPLSDLAKRTKSSEGSSCTCVELAFFTLCDTIVARLGSFSLLVEPLQILLSNSIKLASKSFTKVLNLTMNNLNSNPENIINSSEIINNCKSFWGIKDWLLASCSVEEQAESEDYSELYSKFSQTVLSHLLSTSFTHSDITSPNTHLAILELLSFRMIKLRSLSDSNKISTLPFESFISLHVTFRSLLSSFPKAASQLNESIKKSTSVTTLKEYSMALEDISGLIATCSNSISSNMDSALEIALVLLRDGPEGSSKISTTYLSDLIRHISLYLINQQAQVTNTNSSYSSNITKSYLSISKFLEGICSDRPMLLSRPQVSSILSIVSRILSPSSSSSSITSSFTSTSTPTTTPTITTNTLMSNSFELTSLASELYLSQISIVSNLVRHRKDHITPLFPLLVNCITLFLSILRRPGFGTTGNISVTIESGEGEVMAGGEVNAGIGKRAEREVKLIFPAWVWEGGASGIGKKEAKSLGRLLASLNSKTSERITSTSTKKRRIDATIPSTSTPSESLTSLSAPLSKHSPFLLLPYLHYSVHALAPIPSALRSELQGGLYELMDCMNKFEREALLKGFLGNEEEGERGVLKGLWKGWERERYKG